MVNKKKKNSTGISEYIRIRRYTLNRLYRMKDGDDLRMPSLRELMTRFEVSRPTVCKALRELISDGYLIAKPGLGTFVNPKYAWKRMTLRPILPVIGILFSDGMLIHYEIYYGLLLSEILRSTVTMPAISHQVFLPGVTTEKMYDYLMSEQLDALCWCFPHAKNMPVIENLRAAGLPVVVSGEDLTETPTADVFFAMEEMGERCGKILLEENRNNILYIERGAKDDKPYLGIEKAFRDARKSVKIRRVFTNETTEQTLSEIFRSGEKIDAIFNTYMPCGMLQKILNRENVDTEKTCLLIQNSLNLDGETFENGLLYHFPMSEFGRVMLEKVKAQIREKTVILSKKPERIPLEIERWYHSFKKTTQREIL